jgi:hypothetical protein
MTLQLQVKGSREASWTGSHNGNFPSRWLGLPGDEGIIFFEVSVGWIPVQICDCESFIQVTTPATLFTESGTDPSKGAGQRQASVDDLHRLGKVSGGHLVYERTYIQSCGATGLTGCDAVSRVIRKQ